MIARRRLFVLLLMSAALVGSLMPGGDAAATDQENPRPEAPDGPPVEWIIETYGEAWSAMRSHMGLDGSDEVVAALAADRKSIDRGSMWGIPVTEREYDVLMRRVDDENRRAELLDDIYQADPDAFAGSRDDGDGLVVYLTRVDGEASEIATNGGAKVEAVSMSISDLDVEFRDLKHGTIVYYPSTETVTIYVDDEATRRATAEQAEAVDGVRVVVEVVENRFETDEVGFGNNSTDPGHPCRPASCAPFSGGLYYGVCTSGFGVEELVGSEWGQGYTTAGHCRLGIGYRTRFPREFGVPNDPPWWRVLPWEDLPGTDHRDGDVDQFSDIGLMSMAEHMGVTGTYYRSTLAHWQQVDSVLHFWQLTAGSNGTRLCMSWGRQAGVSLPGGGYTVQCGTVTSASWTIAVETDEDDLSVTGDSGSPYWLESNPGVAVASHQGGQDPVVAGALRRLETEFDSTVITTIDRHHDFIKSMYGRALHRLPDTGGWATWSGQTCSHANLRGMVQTFYKGPEFASLYGTANFSSHAMVMTTMRMLYRGALGREPDQPSWTNWANFIWNAGSPAARQTAWNQTVDTFAFSGEFTVRFASGAIGEDGHGLCAN